MIFSPNVTQMWLVRFGGLGDPSAGSTNSHVAFVRTDEWFKDINIWSLIDTVK